ncbi:TPA: hypothetical protein MM329_000697 [Escherichia coli]|nr:hypothetical protein [Escherichia coli]HBZ8229063.1 hypothetical protein [Escherichia coli]HBZ8345791.1 hypothetical protein [Escherichia coli]HBZ8350860.1 hypothetical protein [Escherichia coli]HBZ8356192.1 hypothetical protein [Escherichia coli]
MNIKNKLILIVLGVIVALMLSGKVYESLYEAYTGEKPEYVKAKERSEAINEYNKSHENFMKNTHELAEYNESVEYECLGNNGQNYTVHDYNTFFLYSKKGSYEFKHSEDLRSAESDMHNARISESKRYAAGRMDDQMFRANGVDLLCKRK